MKANKFFLGLALIGAILTGCNNEPEQVTGPTGDVYVSVKISMASTAGTRATAGDPEFETADKSEQIIKTSNSIFLFYDEAGKWVTSGQLVSSKFNEDNGDCDLTSVKDAYIVLSGPDAELRKSTQVLTVVNYHDVNSLKQLNLTQVLAIVTDSATNTPIGTNGFLMTTSAYADGGKIINTTKIESENIQQSQDLAKAHPVIIHIERASAKATFTAKSEYDLSENTDKDVVVDGVIKNVKVKITGWTLNNVNKETYLVKKLQEGWATAAPFDTWNWAEGHRCYWAEGADWTNTSNVKENDVYKNTVYTFAQANKALSSIMYCYENTVATPDADAGTPAPNVNTVLIAAEFTVDGVTTPNFYKYGGVFYTEENYKNLILKQIQDAQYKNAEGKDYQFDDLTIATDGTLAGIEFTIANANAEQVIAEKNVNEFVAGLSYVLEAEGYAGGKCYYQIPVEHLGTTGFAQYGMVRNHYYKINVSAIKRIGEAVYNPDVIIPDIPENTLDYYLAAEIHVLSWHVVEQDVEL